MKKIAALFLFFIIFILALVFSVSNFQAVEIHLYFTSISLPLALALTIELFAGIAIGYFIAFMQIVKLKSQYSQLHKKYKRIEK